MIDLDPSIIDQESVRKKRRRKMLRIAIIPVLLLIATSIFFIRQGAFDIIFGIAYNAEKADTAITLSQLQKNGNIIEPYIAYYNAGTAYLKDGDGKKAETELQESLKKLPPNDKVCQVRVNLSYSVEIQADEAKILKKYNDALVLFSRAEGILYEDGCASKTDSKNSKDKNADTAKDRISQKRNEVVSEMNRSSGNKTIDPKKGGLEISEEQLKKLQEETSSGNDARSEAMNAITGKFANGGGGGNGGYGIYYKHW